MAFMDNIAIKEKTDYLFAKRFYTVFDSKDYVDWAMFLIENGVENENLYILAGLDSSDTEEREKYFHKTLEDLNIEEPTNKILYAENFMLDLAKKVLNNEINPVSGLKLALGVAMETGYDSKYVQFYCLDEDLDYLMYEGHGLYSNNLSKENVNDYIKKEFELWLKLQNSIHVNISNLAYCQDCNSIISPMLKKKCKFFKHVSNYYCCEKCYSKKLLYGSGQDGRIKIIEHYFLN